MPNIQSKKKKKKKTFQNGPKSFLSRTKLRESVGNAKQSIFYFRPCVVVQPGLCGAWSETPKTGFLTKRLIQCHFFLRQTATLEEKIRCIFDDTCKTGAVVSIADYGPRGHWFGTRQGSHSSWP